MMRTTFIGRMAAVAVLVAATAGAAVAQETVITGKVTGEQDHVIAGASVLIPQLNLGTNTNEKGTYTFTVPAGRVNGQQVVMTVRMIGYTPQRTTITLSAGPQQHDFALAREALQLSEVVVTGTAEATDTKKIGFAVGIVQGEQLHDVPATSPAGALSGKVAGATVISGSGDPGKAPSIKLRSSTSLTGSQDPLIIVDGTITRATLADINSEDIERIEVIKGAAASSLYGSDAANGVVQIFTKRGASLPEDKLSWTFRNEYGQNLYPATIQQSGANAYKLNPDGSFQRDPTTGERVLETDHIADNPYPRYINHQKEALRNGAAYTSYLSVGQRKGSTNYNASFQNLRQEGILFGTKGYTRQNFRLNVDQTVNDRFDLSLGAFYGKSNNGSQSEGTAGVSPFFTLMFIEPHINLKEKNANGTPYKVDPQDLTTAGSNASNTLYDLANTDYNTQRNRYTGTFKGRYRLFDWLVAEGNYNFDGENEAFQTSQPKSYLLKNGTESGGQLGRQEVNGRSSNSGLTLTSTRNLTSSIVNTTKAAIVYEAQTRDTFNMAATQFVAARTPEFGAVTSLSQPFSSNITVNNRNSFLISTFDIKDRYIVDGLVRKDESTLFGSQQRSHTYYRASGAYRVSEDFKLPGVDEFKLRLSHGTAGLRPRFEAQYETFQIQAGQLSKFTLGNKELKPAQSAETEAGFNLDFLSRFSLEYTYSQKTTSDQILLVPLSAATGYRNQWRNAGTLTGNTHEAVFRALLLDRPNASWRFNVTADRTRQKVSKLSVAPFFVGPGFGSGNEDNDRNTRVFRIAEGETFGTIYGNRLMRSINEIYDRPFASAADTMAGGAFARDKFMINEDGYVVRKADYGTVNERALTYINKSGSGVVKIGDVNPDFNMSFNTNLSFHNFNVGALVNWVHGGNIYNATRQWPYFELRDRVYDQRGKPESAKKPTDYYAGSFYNGLNGIDYFVEDGSYMKLKELSVNYTLPTAMLSRVQFGGVESVKIGIVGRNLWTHTKYSGYDPEVSGVSGDPYSFRYDSFSYPNFRTFTGMVELGF